MNLIKSEAQYVRERAKREGLSRLPNETVLLRWVEEFRKAQTGTPVSPAPQKDRKLTVCQYCGSKIPEDATVFEICC